MLFMHVIGDYNLQGVLASMKKKSACEGQGDKYRFDYVPALLAHAFS